MTRAYATLVLVLGVAIGAAAQAPPVATAQARMTVRNPLDLARPGETVVVGGADIKKVLAVDDLRKVYVRDEAGGADVLAQAVDTNDDGVFDEVVFQTDLTARQSKAFVLTVGQRRVYTRDQFRAYGRFVRERRDDFAWENDRTTHRMYGAALETWAQEPLTSSAVDIWFKRTPRLVINDWYMVDDYHRDLGDGADLYSAGKSRGCGGTAPWEAGKLWPSANFRGSRVLANGPIRVMFELTYQAWDVNGRPVSEKKTVTLDAGQQLSRFESAYLAPGAPPARHAAGIKKVASAHVSLLAPRIAKTSGAEALSAEGATLRTWEPLKEGGNWGCAVVMAPGSAAEQIEADGNVVLVAAVPPSGVVVHYAGGAWDKGGDIVDAAAWDAYLRQFASRLASPVQVTIGPKL